MSVELNKIEQQDNNNQFERVKNDSQLENNIEDTQNIQQDINIQNDQFSDFQQEDDIDVISSPKSENIDEEKSLNESQCLNNEINDKPKQQDKVEIKLDDLDQFKMSQNKKYFKNENTIEDIQSMIIKDLLKKPVERRSSNLNELIKITENLPFFKKYAEHGQRDIVVKCCKLMELEFFEKDQNVFEIGTIGDKFYLILEGEVDVYAKVGNSQTPQTQTYVIGAQKNNTNNNNNQTNQINQSQQSCAQEQEVDVQLQSPQNQQIKQQRRMSNISKFQLNAPSKEIQSIQNENETETKVSTKPEQNDQNQNKKTQLGSEDISSIKRKTIILTPQQNDTLNTFQIKKQSLAKDTSRNTPTTAENIQLLLVKKLKQGESFGELALIYNKPRLATIRCTTKCVFAVLQKKHYLDILKNAEQKNIFKAIDKLAQIPFFSNWTFESLRDVYLNSEVVQYKKGEAVFTKGCPSNAVYIVQTGEFSIRNRYENPTSRFSNDALLQNLQSTKGDGIDSLLRQHSPQNKKNFILLKMCVNEMFGEEDLLKDQVRSYDVFCSSFSGSLLLLSETFFRVRIFDRSDLVKEQIQNRLQTKEILFQQKEDNLKEQFSKYKNYLIENRNELKNIIFSQMLMDQSCNMSSPTNQNQQGLNSGQNISPRNLNITSPCRFKSQISHESSKSPRSARSPKSSRQKKQNSFLKLQNTFGTTNSLTSANNFESSVHNLSPKTIRQSISLEKQISSFSSKNESSQNNLNFQIQRDSNLQLDDNDYYYANSPKKFNFKLQSSLQVSNQRSLSDSSRNAISRGNQKDSRDFIDNPEQQNESQLQNKIELSNKIELFNQEQNNNNENNVSNTSQQFRIRQNKNNDKSPKTKKFQKHLKLNIHNENLSDDKPKQPEIKDDENQNQAKIIDDNNQIQAALSKQSNLSPCSQTSTGFFQIEVSKRKKVMLATKYDYQNYLCYDKDGCEKKGRYLIPVKRILNKTFKERQPLLAEVTQSKEHLQCNLSFKDYSTVNTSSYKQSLTLNGSIKSRNSSKQKILNNSKKDFQLENSIQLEPQVQKIKSFYQYSTQTSPLGSQTYYDVSSTKNKKQNSYQFGRITCRSADSKLRTQHYKFKKDDSFLNQDSKMTQSVIKPDDNTIENEYSQIKIKDQQINFEDSDLKLENSIMKSKYNQSEYKERLSDKKKKQDTQSQAQGIIEKEQKIRQQRINVKESQNKEKVAYYNKQITQFKMIVPNEEEHHLQTSKFFQNQSKRCSAATFLQQEQHVKMNQCKSPVQILNPKKVIQFYKQFLLSKQQQNEKSKKFGAYTAFNKTKDTSFYIQNKEEKRMISTIQDWNRSSSIDKTTETNPQLVQTPNNIQQLQPKRFQFSQNLQLQNLNQSIQPEVSNGFQIMINKKH